MWVASVDFYWMADGDPRARCCGQRRDASANGPRSVRGWEIMMCLAAKGS